MKSKILILVGILLVIAGIWALMGSKSVATVTGAGLGERCGGNMTNAPVCAAGLHCAPEPGSHLPFGDVGGTCVRD